MILDLWKDSYCGACLWMGIPTLLSTPGVPRLSMGTQVGGGDLHAAGHFEERQRGWTWRPDSAVITSVH